MPLRLKYLYPFALTVVFWSVYLSCFNAKMDTNGDNAHYYMLSAALAEGRGYVNAMNPNEPAFSYFPPGYALLLSPFRIFTDSIVFLKVLNGACLWGALLLWWHILVRLWQATDPDAIHLERHRLLAAVLLLFPVMSPQLLRFSMMMMSEMPYLLIATLGFWMLVRLQPADFAQPWRGKRVYLLLALLILAFHVRTQGIILLAGVLFYAIMSQKWRFSGFVLGGFVLGALPWMLRNRLHGLSGSSYLDKMLAANVWRPETGKLGFWELVTRFFETQHMLITKALPEVLVPFISVDYEASTSFVGYIGVVLLLGLVGYGLWQMAPGYRYFVIGYFGAMLGIIGLWSAPSGARYVTTLVPMLMVAGMYGLWQLGQRLSAGLKIRLSPYLLLPILLFFVSPVVSYSKVAKAPYALQMRYYFELAKWVGQNLPRETIISCRKPALFYAHAHTYALRYLDTNEPKQLIKALISQKVDYLVRDNLGYSSTPRYLDPAIRAYSHLFTVVLRTPRPENYLLRFDREKAAKMQEFKDTEQAK